MNRIDLLTAEKLLNISAIKLQPQNPFTWASGWTSPIYTDIRKSLSYPQIRTFIKLELSRMIIENFGEPDTIAGIANGAITHAALVADTLMLPYVYVRSTPKDHGLENLIEGNLRPGQKVVLIEEIISTGSTSLKAAEAIRAAGCEVIGIIAIFTFEFPFAKEKFNEAGIPLITLSNYSAMLEAALKINYIDKKDVKTLEKWREDPVHWTAPRLF